MNYIRKFDYFDDYRMESVYFVITWHTTYKSWIPLYAAYDSDIRNHVFETLQKREGMWLDLYSLGIAWNGRWARRIEELDAFPPPDEMLDAKAE
jgi:hypothetical protein